MFDAEDEWDPAICALICRSRADRELKKFIDRKVEPPAGFAEDHMLPNPDPKPLADMFRTGGPVTVPARICDVLAELLDPGDPEYLGCKLQLVETGESRKNRLKLEAIDGQRQTEKRTLSRYKSHWLSLWERLLGG